MKNLTFAGFDIEGFDIEKVPFVPALDLLEMERNKLSEKEASLIALTLFVSLGGQDNHDKTNWEINARTEVLNQRI